MGYLISQVGGTGPNWTLCKAKEDVGHSNIADSSSCMELRRVLKADMLQRNNHCEAMQDLISQTTFETGADLTITSELYPNHGNDILGQRLNIRAGL